MNASSLGGHCGGGHYSLGEKITAL